MKKPESNTKKIVMRFFELKIVNNTPIGYKPVKIRDAFKGRYVEYKSEKDKNVTM